MSKSGYLKISDEAFDESIPLRDAYRIMQQFVSDYHALGDTPVIDFLSYFGIAPDGCSADPAALYDFLQARDKVYGKAGDKT
jgi:hypothetical protein